MCVNFLFLRTITVLIDFFALCITKADRILFPQHEQNSACWLVVLWMLFFAHDPKYSVLDVTGDGTLPSLFLEQNASAQLNQEQLHFLSISNNVKYKRDTS